MTANTITFYEKNFDLSTLQDVTEAYTNSEYIFAYSSGWLANNTLNYLPLAEWSILPEMEVWFGIKANYTMIPRFCVAKKAFLTPARTVLREIQAQYRGVLLLPKHRDQLIDTIEDALEPRRESLLLQLSYDIRSVLLGYRARIEQSQKRLSARQLMELEGS